MQNRRQFLSLTTLAAGALVLPSAANAETQSKEASAMPQDNRATKIFTPKFKFGLGGVPLGNEFNFISDHDAEAVLEAAWTAGVRYYDVSPWYGLGMAERRFGSVLHAKDRSQYVLSSKVGKLLKASKNNDGDKYFPLAKSPNDLVFDYTADGVRRSIEDSLQRLGIDSLDVVFVHDLSPDNPYLPTPWEQQFEIATKGAFPASDADARRGRHQGLGTWGQPSRTDPEGHRGRRSRRVPARFAVFADRPQIRAGTRDPRCPRQRRVAGHRLIPQCGISSREAPDSTTARTTTKSRRSGSPSGSSFGKRPKSTELIFAPRHYNSRPHAKWRSHWSWARAAPRRSPRTSTRCRRKFPRNSGRTSKPASSSSRTRRRPGDNGVLAEPVKD